MLYLCNVVDERPHNISSNFLKQRIMSQQAKNSLTLYKGGNPATIKQLLRMQSSSVVNELKAHFGAKDLDELAVRLSMGH